MKRCGIDPALLQARFRKLNTLSVKMSTGIVSSATTPPSAAGDVSQPTVTTFLILIFVSTEYDLMTSALLQ